MARRRRRSKAGPPNASGLNGVEELRGELESLKAELSSAQADVSEREQSPPGRSRRGVAIAAGVVTAGAGVTAGILLSDQGSQSRVAAPVTAAPSTHSSAPKTQPTASATQPTAPLTQPAPTSPTTTPTYPPPSTTVPPPAPGNRPGGLVVVQRGQSFWSIAQAAETQSLGRVATTAEVARYWLAVVAANASRLPRPGDPNLLYIGQGILLPPI